MTDLQRLKSYFGELVTATTSIGLKSKGAKTEKEFTNSLIKKAKFRFRPGKDMSDLVMYLNYERVPVRKKKGE